VATGSTRLELLARRRWPSLLIGGAILLVFWEYFLFDQTLYAGDTAFIFLPLRHYLLRRLAEGQLPLWNPHLFGGTPALAEAQYQVFYPANLLLWLTGVERGMGWMLPIHLALAAAGTYLFGRRSLGLGRHGAVLAALVFSLGGVMQCKLANSPYVQAAAWLPWALLGYHAARLRGGASLLLPGIPLAAQVCTGAPQYAYYTAILLAVYHLHCLGRIRSAAEHRSAWKALAAGAAVALLLPAAQLLPQLELAGQSDRGLRASYQYATEFSLQGRHALATLLVPHYWGSFQGPPRDGFFPAEEQAYLGAATLPLAAAALCWRRRRRIAWFWLATGVTAALLALGRHNPVYSLLYQAVPGIGSFRAPARWLLLTSFSGAVLAGLGLEATLRGARPARAGAIAAAAVGLAGLALLLGPGAEAARSVPAGPFGHWMPVLCAALAAGLLGWAWRIRRQSASPGPIAACLLAVAVADFFHLSLTMEMQNTLTASTVGTVTEPVRIVQGAGIERFFGGHVQLPLEAWNAANRSLQASPAEARAAAATRMRSLMPSCLPAELGTYGLSGAWGALMPLRRHARPLYDPAAPRETHLRWCRLLNVRYHLSIHPLRDGGLTPITDYLPFLYSDAHVLPRAMWAVPAARAAPFNQALEELSTGAHDARTAALLERPLPVSVVPAGDDGSDSTRAAAIPRYMPEHVLLQVSAPLPGVAVLMDTPYPGWEATVDGSPAVIVPCNAVGRAVAVPAGRHAVEMRFRPASVRAGLFLSLLALGAMAATLAATARSRHTRSDRRGCSSRDQASRNRG
jgi:hypothetical protein